MLDGKTQKTIGDFTERLRSLFEPDLVSVLLYGSAAGAGFDRKRSDINFMIVVEEMAPAHLEKLAREMPAWRRRRVATPLFLDRQYLAQSTDVFPIEFLEIASRYKTLSGEDIFAHLQIDPRNLRYQCEHEARGKLLRLSEIYLEVGNDRRKLRRLMAESAKTFAIIMRAFLRLAGETSPGQDPDTTVAKVEETIGFSLPTVRQVLAARAGRQPWPRKRPREVFFAYHEELRRFVTVIDRFPDEQKKEP